MENKIKKMEIERLKNWCSKRFFEPNNIALDSRDINSEIDSSLSYGENKESLREKLKQILKEPLTKNEVKNEREKEEFEKFKQFKKDEQQANKLFELDVYRLKEDKTTTTDKYKIPIEYIKSVARGYNKAFIFLGGCGLGKSYITRQILAKENIKFIESRGVNSPLGFYQFLYENNRKDLVLVLDDVSGLIDNPNAYSILLGVLWEGLASWNSTTAKLKIPKQFVFNGRIIIIANRLKGELNEFVKDNNAEVVKSRCLTYRIELSREEKIKMMYEIAKQDHKELTEEERVKIVDFIKKNTSQATEGFDLRTQFKIERLFLYDRENWKELAKPLLPSNRVIEVLEYCLANSNSIKDAQRQFSDETGLGRSTFYNLKVQKSSRKPIWT